MASDFEPSTDDYILAQMAMWAGDRAFALEMLSNAMKPGGRPSLRKADSFEAMIEANIAVMYERLDRLERQMLTGKMEAQAFSATKYLTTESELLRGMIYERDMVNSCGWRKFSGGGDLSFETVVEDDSGDDVGY